MERLLMFCCLLLCVYTAETGKTCKGSGRPCAGLPLKCPPKEICETGRCCQQKVNNNCPTGIIGNACNKTTPCKPGSACRQGKCCQIATCPFGDENTTCSPTDPCKLGYYCNKGICCLEYVCRPEELKIGCSSRKPCPKGSVCQSGECCQQPMCPDERQSDGLCKPPTGGEPICPTGYECLNGICCLENSCRMFPAVVNPNCIKVPDKCQTDADCKKGELCCSDDCANRYCKGPTDL